MMEQHPENGSLPPAVFALWEQHAQANPNTADNWRDYARMMKAFQAALNRAPRTAEACTRAEIEQLFVSELEYLANLVSSIFPLGGMMEFAYYVTEMQPDRLIGERLQEPIATEYARMGKENL